MSRREARWLDRRFDGSIGGSMARSEIRWLDRRFDGSTGGSTEICFNVRPLGCTPGSMFVRAIAGRVEVRSEQRREP